MKKQRALLEGRHELAAETGRVARDAVRQAGVDGARQAEGDHAGRGEQRDRAAEHGLAVDQRPVEHGLVDFQQAFHQPVLALGLEGAAHEERAEHRDGGDGQQHRAEKGEALGVGERVEELALLAGQQKHRHEGQDDDQHREEHRPADLGGGYQRVGEYLRGRKPPFQLLLGPFAVADDVLRHHDAGVDQHADGDGDAGERHDVRR
jgi:hypothetical protein